MDGMTERMQRLPQRGCFHGLALPLDKVRLPVLLSSSSELHSRQIAHFYSGMAAEILHTSIARLYYTEPIRSRHPSR